jgi:hypothetical protein
MSNREIDWRYLLRAADQATPLGDLATALVVAGRLSVRN